MIKAAFRSLIKPYLSLLKKDLAPYFDFRNKEQIIHPNQTFNTGWYTIAYIGDRYKADGNASGLFQRAYASFCLVEQRGGQHQMLHFDAAHHYGQGSMINVLGTSSYDDPTNIIKNMRIQGLNTYDGAVLQIFIATSSHIETLKMYNNLQNTGWTMIEPVLAGSADETAQLKPILPKIATYNTLASVTINARELAIVSSGDIRAKNFDCNNGAFIAARSSTSNIDHIWHDDSKNTWHACSDTAYKAQGNANVQVGSMQAGTASYKKAWRKLTATLPTGAGEVIVAHGVTNMGARSATCVASDGIEVVNNDPDAQYQFYLRKSGGNILLGKAANTPKLDAKTVTIYVEEVR